MSTIALELVLTRIYSVTMYYHFAFLAISVALLGLAAAGSTIFVLPRVFTRERTARHASGFMIGFALATLWALYAAVTSPISLTNWSANLGRLVHVYISAAAPLVCSGFAISLAIAAAGEEIGRIYMTDLIGAGLGCVLVVPAIRWFGAPGAIMLVGALGAVSAVGFALADRPAWSGWRYLAGAAAIVAVVLGALGATEGSAHRFGIVRNPTKFIGHRPVLFESWNSFSQITVGPAGDPDHDWIFIDGDAATRMWKAPAVTAEPDPRMRFPEIRAAAAVYALRPAGPAAIIGPGGGSDVVSALRAGVGKVVAIEINPIIVDQVMRGKFAALSGHLYDNPKVDVVVDEGRSYLRRTDQKFATIQATLVDTWAASSSGAFTLSENNLYTVEAFDEFFDALAPGGILSITRWYDASSPAEFVRLLAIARRSLERRGVDPAHVRDHVFVITDHDRRATLMVSRDAFGDADRAKLVQLAADEHLGVLYIAGRATPDRLLAGVLEAPALSGFLSTLPYDATPTTDNQPFFFYHQHLGDVLGKLGHAPKGKINDVGLYILVLLLAFSLVTSVLFVIVPLLLFRRGDLATDRRRKLRVIGYFACLGLGFILVELGFMQQFVLFLGHPVYSLAVVLSSLLLSSGVGARLSAWMTTRWGPARARWIAVAALGTILVAYGLWLSSIFGALIALALPVRIAIAVVFVTLPGLLMGTFLPRGVLTADAIAPGLVAWGWGLNGATSVVGSTLAVMLSINFGFRTVLLIGVACYVLAGLALPDGDR